MRDKRNEMQHAENIAHDTNNTKEDIKVKKQFLS